MKRILLGSFAALALFSTGVAAGKLAGHPNLKAAHKMILDAMGRIDKAQAANEYDMDGHAAKAKDLLSQAEHEIGLAADAANANK